ncbi:MAG: hypothetical protein E3K37_09755 [Candidatus Kuenenia sp.]|nr:hypothetical protein [Candidatus Kuenenia hertensis]
MITSFLSSSDTSTGGSLPALPHEQTTLERAMQGYCPILLRVFIETPPLYPLLAKEGNGVVAKIQQNIE